MNSFRATWKPYIVTKATGNELSAKAVLTFPMLDLAGDLVRPEGLDFSLHEADPWVDLEHGRTEIKRQPVGWARKSLSQPGEPYALEWADLDVPNVGICRLPVGTTYFDRNDPLQRQVYELIRQDALPGVSLEFIPVESRVIYPQSPLEQRPAYEFLKAKVLRWSHCAEPVNPGALTVLKSLPPSVEVIVKAVRDNFLAGEPLHPYLRQVYDNYRIVQVSVGEEVPKASPSDPRPCHPVATEQKAMPENNGVRETAYEPQEDQETAVVDTELSSESDQTPPHNGVSALYAHVQALLDACEQLEQDLEATDSPELYKAGMQLCEQTRALAEKVKAIADKHDAKLESLKSNGEVEETEESPEEEETSDISTDREGLLKAVRPVYRDILRAVRAKIKRYRMRDIIEGVKRARDPMALIEEIKAKDPIGYEKLIKPRLRRLKFYSVENGE